MALHLKTKKSIRKFGNSEASLEIEIEKYVTSEWKSFGKSKYPKERKDSIQKFGSEGRPWVPHSVEYDDLSTPYTSARQRYVSDHSP